MPSRAEENIKTYLKCAVDMKLNIVRLFTLKFR